MIFDYKGITPVVGSQVYIAPTASVVGDVIIGSQSSIWFNAVVRGDNGTTGPDRAGD